MHWYREIYCQIVFCVYFVYMFITCKYFYFRELYRVILVDFCTVAWCYVIMSSNLSGFAYKFSPVDQFLCSLFKRQRRRFLPVKLCTVKVNIFLYCESILSIRSLKCIFLLMFSTLGVRVTSVAWLPVEFRPWCDRGVRTREFSAFCLQWISLALLTDISWKRSCRGLSSWTKAELRFPKSAQIIKSHDAKEQLLEWGWGQFILIQN